VGRFEFAELIYENLGLYFVIFSVVIGVYYKVLKPLYWFLLDPFMLSQIFSMFATTVVVFLAALGEVDVFYSLQFTMTQIAFWVGLYYFKFDKTKNHHREKTLFSTEGLTSKLKKQTIYIYVYMSIAFILSQILIYIKIGVPLFLESRLTLYEGSGGWGFLGKITDVLNVVVFIGSLYVRNYFKHDGFLKIYSLLILGFIFIVYILSGSKSSIINFFSLYFLFLIMYDPMKIHVYRKYEIYAVLLTFIGAIVIFSIHNSTESPFLLFLDRLVGSGDVFYQGYFTDKIDKIEGNPLTLLFTDILGTYRIVPWAELPRPIGMQLYTMVYNVDLSMGANARHNYLGLVTFGFGGSILFSYFLGWSYSYIRNRLYEYFFSKGFLLTTFYILLLQGGSFLETDFTMFVSRANSMFITYTFLAFFLLLLITISYLIGYSTLKSQHDKPE
jgi:hypothetical protein